MNTRGNRELWGEATKKQNFQIIYVWANLINKILIQFITCIHGNSNENFHKDRNDIKN